MAPKNEKRTSTKRRKMRIAKQPSLIAEQQDVTLRYVDFFTLDAGVGNIAYNTWRANGIFDPYVATGGHQPLGADQWAQFYRQYVVLGSKATCYADVYAGAAQDAIWLVGKTDTSTSAPATNVNQAIEQNKAAWRFLTPAGSDRSQGKVNLYYSPRTQFGITDISDNGDLVGVSGVSDPTTNCYFHVQVGGSNPADNPTAVNCRIVIEYRVRYMDRISLTQS